MFWLFFIDFGRKKFIRMPLLASQPRQVKSLVSYPVQGYARLNVHFNDNKKRQLTQVRSITSCDVAT